MELSKCSPFALFFDQLLIYFVMNLSRTNVNRKRGSWLINDPFQKRRIELNGIASKCRQYDLETREFD